MNSLAWRAVLFSFLFLGLQSVPEVRDVTAEEAKSAWRAEWRRTLQAAKKEGAVVIYGSSSYEELFREFQKKYPEISVKGFFARGRGVALRMMAERRGTKYLADLYLNGMTTGYNVLYKAKVVDPIKSAFILPEVVDSSKWWRKRHHFVDPEGRYLLVFNGQSRVDIAYNTNLVKPKEVKSYWDLLKPKWKGKIVSMDPNQGAAGTTLRFMYYSPLLGPEFLRRLFTETNLTISRDSRQMGDWVASGKYAFSILNAVSRMDVDKAKMQGLPVDWFGPRELKEGAAITAGSGGVALINRAPHPNAAKVAINWLLSREGQMAYQRISAIGAEGADSLRIDISKNVVPQKSRRVDGEQSKYPQTDRAEWMDMTPIRKFIKQVRRRGR